MHLLLVLIWAISILAFVKFVRAKSSLCLSIGLAYSLSLTFLHFLGALIYLNPFYDPSIDLYLRIKGTTAEQTIYGFRVATQFLVTYCLSYSLFATFFLKKSNQFTYLLTALSNLQIRSYLRYRFINIFRFIFKLSIAFYSIFFILKLVSIPSVSQIFAQGPIMLISSLMIAEFLFFLGYELIFYIGLLVLLILFIQGFLSYSASFIIIILGLMLSYKTLKPLYFFYSLFLLIISVTTLKAWLVSRDIIREFIFSGQSLNMRSILDFSSEFYNSFMNSFQSDYSAIFIAIDTRLNLNNILGRVVENWDPNNTINSIEQLYVAFIPRLIWPSKPVLSSSTEWVEQLAHMSIAENVSVGLGHIAELYGNFGLPGVYFGAITIAFTFYCIDYFVNLNLSKMYFIEAWGFMMIGLSLIQPGGIFVKALNAAFITVSVFIFVNYIIIYFFGKNRIRNTKAELFMSSRPG